MDLMLEVQPATTAEGVPGEAMLRAWAEAALTGRKEVAELVIRVVDEPESRTLNRAYRHLDRPTNVLSFPSDLPAVVESRLLGDLIICAPVVEREALEQGKPAQAHWAHMVVHGVLHLLGFDHQNEQEAEVMEGLEQEIMSRLGFPDPYRVKSDE
jgi:probable rRNA maturation factor